MLTLIWDVYLNLRDMSELRLKEERVRSIGKQSRCLSPHRFIYINVIVKIYFYIWNDVQKGFQCMKVLSWLHRHGL
jgi:hypothetical protein